MMFWYATAWGIGLSPDSGFYIKSARHMLGREQVDAAQTREMSSHFPPMYAGVLAMTSLGGVDPQTMARGVNLILFMACTGLIALVVWKVTEGSALAALLAGLFVIFAPDSLGIFTIALSEGLFVCLVMVSFLLLAKYAETSRSKWAVSAGIVTGAAVLTRYAGVAMVPVGLVITLWMAGDRAKRVRDASIFVALCLTPVVMVAAVNKLMWGTSLNRTSAIHPVGLRHLRDGLITAAGWVLPVQVSSEKLVAGGVIVALAGVVGVVVCLRERRALPRVAILFVIFYLLTLGLSISLVDYHTPVDKRLLLPVLMALVIVAASVGQRIAGWNAWLVVICAGIFVTGTIVCGGIESRRMHRDGIGYASAAWQRSELVRAVKAVPAEKVVYSNAADVVYLVARRQAMPVPAKVIATSTLANPDYEKQLTVMGAEIHARRAVLAYFTKFESKRPYYPTESDLAEKLRLRVLVHAKDGGLYEAMGHN